MPTESNEFAGPLWCPLCYRVAGPHGWATNERYGYRVCPRCRREGLGDLIPRQLPDDDPRAVRWRLRRADSDYRSGGVGGDAPPPA